ncbi:hypothetical protein ABFX02_14G036500 [Erythranthe guttata]
MAAAAVFKVVGLLILVCTAATFSASGTAAATWCVARSDASEQALQTALDYACGAGADCAPIQSSGLCYLPNTVQAHASYAFNSYYQRKANAPDSCSFAGTSAIAKTDPSYGSCVYPSSPSTAGGAVAPGGTAATGGASTPLTTQPPPPGTTTTTAAPLFGSGGGAVIPDSPKPNSSQNSCANTILSSPMTMLLIFLFIFKIL